MSAQEIMNDCREKMDKAIESTKHKFASIRAGRANVSMLDGIKVEQYGSEMPLNQVANVSAPEARLLVIDPWDKSIIQKIEKTIMLSNLGLTPNNDGKVIRLQIPELTAERRKEYVKLAKTEAENGKIAIRNIRKDANNHLRRLEKDGDITQDELKSFEDDTQKITDNHIKLVDELLKKKEKEITTV
ncbi:ribosome recycling factor [Ilyobacter polytropus]|uniref:Ribosome-recycling factor n=1 Tax=Ilyobacter polytropus (strain ATCC 51220 / DSM 2926 / LMG 16218 / CuHBu1) TaxID=572544 RepID=E3H8Z2_ILYPC|nr:ribosome recycling factor [Ilyobacter polytropus]ADO83546.1 ribosome recycling factor [Ilyobacter polytropus DSM 2926]